MRLLRVGPLYDPKAIPASVKTIEKAWSELSSSIVMTTVGIGPSRTIAQGGYRTTVFLEIPRPSKLKLVQKVAALFFGDFGPLIASNLDGMMFGLISFRKLRNEIRRSDRIFSYEFWFAAVASLFPSVAKKTIYNENGGEWIEVAEGRASIPVILRYRVIGVAVLNRVRIIAQSQTNARHMTACGVRPNRIRIVKYGRVDSAIFSPSRSKPNPPPFEFLFVGRLVPQKGVHILVEAADILVNKRHRRDVFFTIIGQRFTYGNKQENQYLKSIQRAICRFKLGNYFNFKDFVPQSELVDAYSTAHAVILPSIQDAFPWTVVEAMTCGTPVIGTYSGGMAEMIRDGFTGFLVSPNDPVALAEKLLYFMDSYDVTRSMGSRARSFALSNFTFDGFKDDLLRAISED